MIAKLAVAAIAALLAVPLLGASGLHGAISAIFGGGSQPSATALADIWRQSCGVRLTQGRASGRRSLRVWFSAVSMLGEDAITINGDC